MIERIFSFKIEEDKYGFDNYLSKKTNLVWSRLFKLFYCALGHFSDIFADQTHHESKHSSQPSPLREFVFFYFICSFKFKRNILA